MDVEIQYNRAIKATLLLFPLLGTTHLLFLVNPKDSRFEVYYMHFNAWLQSSQVCFLFTRPQKNFAQLLMDRTEIDIMRN